MSDALVDLAVALGLALKPNDRGPTPREASGPVGGFEVFLGAITPPRAALPVRVETTPPRDLRLDAFTRPPRQVFQLRDAVRDGELWLRGRGDPARLRRLLAGAAGERLREVAHLDVEVRDRGVIAYLPRALDTAAQATEVRRLIALASALAGAARDVPIDPDVAWAEARFVDAAATLGLAYTSCPLGLGGVLDGCRVTTRSLHTAEGRVVFFHVELRHVIPGAWAVRSQGRAWWQRFRGAFDAVIGRGPRSGRFAFDRRFHVDGARGDAMRAVAAHLDPLIDFVDQGWLMVQGDRVVAGCWVRPRTMPDLVDLLRRTVAIAHLVGGGPDTPAPAGPFR